MSGYGYSNYNDPNNNPQQPSYNDASGGGYAAPHQQGVGVSGGYGDPYAASTSDPNDPYRQQQQYSSYGVAYHDHYGGAAGPSSHGHDPYGYGGGAGVSYGDYHHAGYMDGGGGGGPQGVGGVMMEPHGGGGGGPMEQRGHGLMENSLGEEGEVLDGGEEDEDEESSSVGDIEEEDEESAVDFDDPRIADLPRILLMGPRRAGKTSIQRVVFHKMSPHETLFRLEATQNLERAVVDHTPLCRFTIWDFPGDFYGSGPISSTNMTPDSNLNNVGAGWGVERPMGMPHHHHPQQPPHSQSPMGAAGGGMQIPSSSTSSMMMDHHHHRHPSSSPSPQLNQHDNPSATPPTATVDGSNVENSTAQGDVGDAYVFGRATALIFVIDAVDEPYDHVLQSFTETVTRAIRANPHIAIEVFINKVDGELFLSDEAKYDCRRDVMQQVSDELADAGVIPDSVPISYHLTSIYDHSVFEAFSRVVQKLIPQLPTLENLLNVLVSTCSMEKAYLFDVASKLYISTDSSPVDMQSVELCSDMIDVVLDVSGIYGLGGGGRESKSNGVDGDMVSSSVVPAATGTDNGSLSSDLVTGAKALEGGGDDGEASNVVGGDLHSHFTNDSAVLDYGNDGKDELVGTLISQGGGVIEEEIKEKDVDADSAYDSESSSIIRLSNGVVLYLKEVDTMLALVCLTRSENFKKKALINYNISCLKKALRALVEPSSGSRNGW